MTTKAELKALLEDYLENEETSFVDNEDIFIRLAEEDIYRQVQLPDLRKSVTTTLVAADPYLGVPGDFLSAYTLAVIVAGEYSYLTNKDNGFIREAYPDPTSTGTPRYFAQFDDENFILGPSPASTYSVELNYFYQPESLADGGDDDTTWLSENGLNALLFGTLLHGYIYMKGDQDVIASYEKQFQKAVADLKTIAEGRNRKDTYRTPDRRLPT